MTTNMSRADEPTDEEIVRAFYTYTVMDDEPLFTFDRKSAIECARAILAASPVEQPAAAPIELARVKETLEAGRGFWRTCSGCHESEDGHPVGEYPYSETLQCDLGAGCGECGGIGAVWDSTDYEDLAAFVERREEADEAAHAAPSPADERAALPQIPDLVKATAWLTVCLRTELSRLDDNTHKALDEVEAQLSCVRAITNGAIDYEAMVDARAASANETAAEGAADLAERAHLAAGQWANSNTPIAEALAYRDGFIAGARSPAMAAAAVPRKAGYVLVPVEPTQAMLDRGYWPCTQGRGAKSVWGEMLRAIPAAPQPAQADVRVGLTDSTIDRYWHQYKYGRRQKNVTHKDLFADILRAVAQPEPRAEVTDAARDVLAERRRQIEQEGWTPAHDDQYRDHELSCAAGCYAMYTLAYPAGDPPPAWPWAADWWKPTTHRRNLVKAGALIQAAIERLDRAGVPQ
ncbi:hypothetical protein [Burkholderia cenocepacia]|uniref:hypothetical protein n=1 Tax=Burkholderia cenocepacia TaxID=95486 RepID=UPI00222F90DE|nr:hypothetical protein [Burkholderia cenocepacia]